MARKFIPATITPHSTTAAEQDDSAWPSQQQQYCSDSYSQTSTPSSADVPRSSSNMPSLPSSPSGVASQPYLVVPNLHVPDTSVREIELGTHSWIVATVIEDDDLMFGGKPLSAWYEEERQRQSSREYGDEEEEEQRGRPRERPRVLRDGHHHHHHHHHNHDKHRDHPGHQKEANK